MNVRIKKLDIFIAKQFGLLFLGTFFICQFVLMMQFLWRYVEEVIGKGLSMEVLAQFFWYMALMLVPQALPLAILLSSLITFGNLGESSELTAIKAAGISLMQTFRSLIIISVAISVGSFYFQNNIGPKANMKLSQLLLSMKQKSPELEIPEGVFYDGIPNCNLYVQKKDLKTGHLFGIMIYRMTDSYEDAAIILADSGMIQSTAEKKHLLLHLWSGEWFENMQSSQLAGSAAVPYRRETFATKQIVLDFDGDFSMTDAASLANNARGKSLGQIRHDIDSLNCVYDSAARTNYAMSRRMYNYYSPLPHADSVRVLRKAKSVPLDFDKTYAGLPADKKRLALTAGLTRVQNRLNDLQFMSMAADDNERLLRQHEIEAINKFTLALQCMIFFFIGAPLGAIIRKGGLGVPIITSVLVFIVYYILDNSGYRMARGGMWSVWFGKLLAPAIMSPVAVFVTYKAFNDSMVFNMDLWRDVFMRVFGLRLKRHVDMKEVIIHEPDYGAARERLLQITRRVQDYSRDHYLKRLPNPINVFFKYRPDHEIERVSEELESVIADLSNTRDVRVLSAVNRYPVLSVKAHTRPFEHRRLNILAAVIVPAGLFFYLRMWRFRLRLYHDLRVVKRVNDVLCVYLRDHYSSSPQESQVSSDS